MEISRPLFKMPTSPNPVVFLLMLTVSVQGARIFRNPEPHLPENLPSGTDQGAYVEVQPDASESRSAPEEESYFAPGAWRPVRDPELSSSGRRRISSLGSTGHAGELHVASGRHLRLEDGKLSDSSEARTPPPSANSPATTLGQSIALVANQLLHGTDIVESRSPEASTTTSAIGESWPQAPLDVRTPPKLMLQVAEHKQAEVHEHEPTTNVAIKNIAPINDDPMGENFFPSRRHPPGVATTPGMTITQLVVSTTPTKKVEQKLPSVSSTTFSSDTKKVEKSPLTTSSLNKKTPTTSTAPTPITTPTTPTSVRWKIAIPPNRPARFPPRKPVTQQAGTTSPVNANKDVLKKDNRPVTSGASNLKPTLNSGATTRPSSFYSRHPALTTVKGTTSSQPIETTSQSVFKPTTAIPIKSTTTTTTTPSTITTTSGPTITTTTHPPTTAAPKETSTAAPTVQTTKAAATDLQPKSPQTVDIVSESKPTEVSSKETSSTVEIKDEISSTTTARPKRPSNKRKKNKNRRRRPSKKPSSSAQDDSSSSSTDLEVKESPQGENTGNVASPLSTRIYNFIAREVMPSMSVGLLGLVVTAGLAGYFLLPTLGGLQRRSDATTDGLISSYGSGSSYGGYQEDDGGIMTTIFQNVMASVRNGEKEFERGPRRRRRNVVSMDESENEIDVNLYEKNGQNPQMSGITTPISTANENKDAMTDQTTDHSIITSDEDGNVSGSTLTSLEKDEGHTTEEPLENESSTQEVTPVYEWEGQYDDNPFSLMGILRRIADFKIRLGVGILRATTDVIARYLEDVQRRLRDSDRQEWLRNLESSMRRIRKSIDLPAIDSANGKPIPFSRRRFNRVRRMKRHG